jgi:hypothetical protein
MWALATSKRSRFLWVCLAFGLASQAYQAAAQLQFTEVMYEPGGSDALWEWVEIRNTSLGAVDLNGWVFDDDDGATFGMLAGANIRSSQGNTLIPAGGVAVLYAGDQLGFTPARFSAAWGGEINLIGVDGFAALTEGDAIGLWPSYSAYAADTIVGATTSPRRTFAGAAATLDYSVGFPSARNRRSIAWQGTGSPNDGAQWVESTAGVGGGLGPYHEVTSVQTTIAQATINDTADRGNPGTLPAGPASSGLLITEIMFAPASPAATAGWSSDDFEWVEIYNNTSGAIQFGTTPYLFDDFAGELHEPNISSGSLAVGQTGILFNSENLTTADMATMWGAGKNYIPVTAWPALNNAGGDTIAIWDHLDDYDNEPIDDDGHRAHTLAVASVVYDTLAGQGWPTIPEGGGSSIFLNNLSASPNQGSSWTRTGASGDNLGSYNASPLVQTAIDHPGDDVGSPGYAPGAVPSALLGDYNGNHVVDAADYTAWRNSLGGNSLLNDATPGMVGVDDYNYWKTHFGATGAASSGMGAFAVPEPASAIVLVIAVVGWTGCRRKQWRTSASRCARC